MSDREEQMRFPDRRDKSLTRPMRVRRPQEEIDAQDSNARKPFEVRQIYVGPTKVARA